MVKSTPTEMRQLREEVFARSGGVCEWPPCTDAPEELAHLTHRGMGGSRAVNVPSETAAMCKRHHDVLDGRTALGTLRWELNELMRWALLGSSRSTPNWLASQEQTPARVFPNYEKAEMAFRVAFDPTTDEAFTDAIYAAVNAALDYAKDKQNLDYGRLRGVLWYYGVEPTDDLVSALAALGLPHSETDPEEQTP